MKKLNLLYKLLISIIIGILIGAFLPASIVRIAVTFTSIFGNFLSFIIPLMIIAFVTIGIADLSSGAGKLLGITTGLSYFSTVVAGAFAFLIAKNLFPKFIDLSSVFLISNPEENMLKPYFTIDIPPMLNVTTAIVFAFVMGLCISSLREKNVIKDTTYKLFSEFSEIIKCVLSNMIIPLLPIFILGTFANMTYSGQIISIMSVFWKVFTVVILLHLVYLLFIFTCSSIVGKKKLPTLLKNQIPGYVTAVGTQSSAACIPVNMEVAKNNGVSQQIREFVIPLCSNIHMAGSVITITCCSTAVMLMYNMHVDWAVMIPFVLTLGVAMVASPGAPGGSIMAALPFLPIIGISPDGAIASLLIALYIAQDSFGTAANVSGDNAIAVIVDTIHDKFIKKPEK